MATARNGRMAIASLWRCLGLLGLALVVAHATKLPRGVDPQAANLYDAASGKFTCKDRSLTLPFERVNDDYCDCVDGSDEPGTSACPNSSFHCRNTGHHPRTLSSSFVDDTICDCCDGSDEQDGVCSNTCLEASAPEFESYKHDVSVYGKALEQRASYVQASEDRKLQWAARFSTIGADIEAKQVELQFALGQKQQAEAEHERLRQARAHEEQQHQAQQQQQHQGQQEQQQQDQQQLSGTEQAPSQAQAQASSPEGETPEERGRRIASQWTTDPAAAAARAKAEAGHVAGQQPPAPSAAPPPTRLQRKRAGEKLSELEEFLMFTDMMGGYFSNWGRWFKMVLTQGIKQDILERREKAKHRRQILLDRLYGQLGPNHQQRIPLLAQTSVPDAEMSEALREAIAHVGRVEGELQALKREQYDIMRFSSGSFNWGADDVFFSFAGRCFEDNTGQFTYELCFYDGATQKSSYGNQGGANLGTWRGFFASSADPNDSSFMAVVDGGDACSNSVTRSYKVRIVCGEGDKLHSTTETSLCTYEATFATPAACSSAVYSKMSEGLAALARTREDLRAAIASGKHHDEL